MGLKTKLTWRFTGRVPSTLKSAISIATTIPTSHEPPSRGHVRGKGNLNPIPDTLNPKPRGPTVAEHLSQAEAPQRRHEVLEVEACLAIF